MVTENGTDNAKKITTIGGTFDALHFGHKEYIRLAYQYAEYVRIYLTSDQFARYSKNYKIIPYTTRLNRLKEYIDKLGFQYCTEFKQLNSLTELQYDFLENKEFRERVAMTIISPEYYDYFVNINKFRLDQGLHDFAILVKMHSRNGDNIEYSSERVRNGAIKGRDNYYREIDFSTLFPAHSTIDKI